MFAGKEKKLFAAVKKGDLEEVKKLVASGAQIEARESQWGGTPLHQAVEGRHLEIVKFLVEKGAPVDAKDNLDRTVLHSVIGPCWDRKIAEFLVEKDEGLLHARDKISGKTLLHWAAANNRLKIAEFLLEKGARPDAKDDYGYMPQEIVEATDAAAVKLRALLEEWNSPAKMEGRRWASFGEMAAGVIARQRQLGKMRPKSPGL